MTATRHKPPIQVPVYGPRHLFGVRLEEHDAKLFREHAAAAGLKYQEFLECIVKNALHNELGSFRETPGNGSLKT